MLGPIQTELNDHERRLRVLERHQEHGEIMSSLHVLSGQLVEMKDRQIMDAASTLAAITANNDRISSQTAALVALAEGQADIVSEIAALKAANPGVDFAPIEAKLSEQTTLLDGADKAIGANTSSAQAARRV